MKQFRTTSYSALSLTAAIVTVVMLILVLFTGVILYRQGVKQAEQKTAETRGKFATPISVYSVLVANDGGRVSWSQQNVIAYSILSSTKLGGEIYTMAPNGSNKQCVTCNNDQIPHISNDVPAQSPDGKYIVFESVDPQLYSQLALPASEKQAVVEGGSGIDNNLWAITSNGSHAYQLTAVTQGEASLHPHFSFDGNKLLWASRAAVSAIGKTSFQWRLNIANFLVSPSGPTLENVRSYQPLGSNVFYESHGFTPDGRYIIFSSSANPSAAKAPSCECTMSLWEMNIASGQAFPLTNTTNVWNEHAHISPSGKHVVWVSSEGYPFTPSTSWGTTLETDLWLMNANGSNPHQITFFNVPGSPEHNGSRVIIADSAWNPSGNRLVASVLEIGKTHSTSMIIIFTFDGVY